MTDLIRLAERVEKLTGPDDAVDFEILCFVDPRAVRSGPLPGDPKYTDSLDAAMTLVPEGAGLHVNRYWIAKFESAVWSALLTTGGVPENPRRTFEVYDAANPALALTAAALRSLAAQRGQG